MNALTTPTKTLFLSYSRRQTEWCNELYTAIDTDTPYYRWRDNKIPESADWWNSICLNIEGCYAFVAILTQDYLDSVYCMGELDYALKLNKPVIALMLQEVDYPQKLKEMRLQFAR
ncbi:MAG: toll/interleukin-1 receptor domain-containing protein, partial [Chloroflexota bacterium]